MMSFQDAKNRRKRRNMNRFLKTEPTAKFPSNNASAAGGGSEVVTAPVANAMKQFNGTVDVATAISTTAASPSQVAVVSKKRIMTMSQLRRAAVHASLSSPLKRLIIASPIAQRIRHDILKSGEIKPRSITTTSLLLQSRLPSSPSNNNNGNNHNLLTTTPASSRRQRLHESRFRRHSVAAGAALDNVPSKICGNTTKTPLSCYASNFLSPPSLAIVQRLVHQAATPAPSTTTRTIVASTNTRSIATSPDAAIVQKRDSTTTSSSTPRRTSRASRGRRSSSERSPLQALMVASNQQSPKPPVQSPTSTTAQELPIKLSHASSSTTTATTTNTRRNLDKRTARIWHAASFEAAIDQLKNSNSNAPSTTHSRHHLASSTVISVVIRKRPLFPNERARGDFDAVSIPQLSSSSPTSCTVYKTMLEANMKTQSVIPHTYPCTMAFDERSTTLQIFSQVVEPLLRDCLQPQQQRATTTVNSATVLMFGQTGSGKTYTMSGLEHELVQRIPYPLTLQCLEVSGKICRDLLNDDTNGSDTDDSDENRGKSPIRIVDHGATSVVGAQATPIDTSDQLLNLLSLVKSRRATSATDRNLESSRSHSLCTLRFATGGSLTLVDCAGTERKHDSMHHTKDRRVESSEINTSLYALKECIRARASNSPTASPTDVEATAATSQTRIPYRSSLLTRILRPHLEGRLAVIATIAPNATDTEHSIQTLETVSSLLGVKCLEGPKHSVSNPAPSSSPSAASKPVPPKRWDHQQLVEFLQCKRLLSGSSPIPATLTGGQVMRYNKLQLSHVLHLDSNDSDKLFHLLRAEASRIDRLELKRRMQMKKSPNQ